MQSVPSRTARIDKLTVPGVVLPSSPCSAKPDTTISNVNRQALWSRDGQLGFGNHPLVQSSIPRAVSSSVTRTLAYPPLSIAAIASTLSFPPPTQIRIGTLRKSS